jgi:hypothetical protein
MKKSFFLLIVFLTGYLGTNAQSPSKDSLYFVRLQNGTTLYSNKVSLVNSLTQGKYLLLDNNQRIPLSQAKDFKGWAGTFAIANIGGQYDAYKLQNEGRRISLYSQCYYTTETYYTAATPGGVEFPTTITTREKAYYFRKGTDSSIERLTIHNLKLATADNPASTHELGIAGTNIHLSIGLLAGGVALVTAGIITTVNHNRDLSNAFDQASAKWFQEAQTNPNTPMPTAPHYSGLSPLFFIGTAATFSAFIPLFNVGKHVQKALDIYNGID